MSRALGSASPKLRSATIAVAFASVYFLTAVLTDSLVGDAGVAVLWPASGVYLGVMLVSPHRNWPALVFAAGIGSLAAYLYGGSSLQVSVAFAVPSCAEGFLAALFVERIARKRFRLVEPRDLFALVVGGAVIANALIGLSAGAVAAQTFHASFAESWLRWWSADALGMLAVAPIVTAPTRPGLPRPSRWWSGPRLAGLGGLGAALVAMQLVSKGALEEVYGLQAFLAVLLLGSLGLVLAAAERARMREELGRAREGSAEERDRIRRRVEQLTAELAARRAEVIQSGRGQERLSESLRTSERARTRAERELDETRNALASAKEELDALSRDLGLTVADRDRAQTELRESTRALAGVQAELEAATANLARARQNSRALESELERSRAETRALDEELERTRIESQASESALESARQVGQTLKDELESARRETRALAEELQRAELEARKLADELQGAELESSKLAEELQSTELESSKLSEELESAHAANRTLEEELERVGAEQARAANELAAAISDRSRLEDELERAGAEQARAANELAAASSDGRRVEQALESARAQHAHLAEELEAAVSGRRLAEEELALVAGRVEGLERELERSRREHRNAELALEHARARFAERRERLERALHEATGNGARAADEDGAPELSSRYDDRGRCLSASPAFAALLGYRPEELVGRPGAELLHPDDRPRLARARAARTQNSFQGRLRRKLGDYVAVEVSLDPVWNGDRRLVELRTTVRTLASQRAAA